MLLILNLTFIVLLGLLPWLSFQLPVDPRLVGSIISFYILLTYVLAFGQIRSASRIISSGSAEPFQTANPWLYSIVQHNKKVNEEIEQAMIVAQQIGAGKYLLTENNISPLQSRLQELGQQLAKAAGETQRTAWSLTGEAKLSEILRNEDKELTILADKLTDFAVRYVGGSCGALYVSLSQDGETTLHLRGKYGLSDGSVAKCVAPGQGMGGQCFVDRSPILVKNVPKEFYVIASGLGRSSPMCLALIPLVANNDCIGVLEIGSFQLLSEHEMDWLVRSSESIASAIKSVESRERITRLLDESEQQRQLALTREQSLKNAMENLERAQLEAQKKNMEINAMLAELESVKADQVREIQRLESQHIENLKLVEQKAFEAETAKMEVENIRRIESDRLKQQTDIQSKIMQTTLEKFKKRESEMNEKISERERLIATLQSELDTIRNISLTKQQPHERNN